MSHAHKRIPTLACLALAAVAGPALAQQPPCPDGSIDRAFEMDRDLDNCVFGRVEGNAPGVGYGRYYNIFCPGRMSKSQALQAADALARDPTPAPGNPIPDDYAPLGLSPRYAYTTANRGNVADDLSGVHHLFHYECGTRGVATHIKVEIGSAPKSSLQIAEHCDAVNQAGAISAGSRVDIEYRCKIHLSPAARTRRATVANCPGCTPPFIDHVATVLAREEVVPMAQDRGVRTCLLDSTDIQCAPCRTSDKLIVRMAFVGSGGSCPQGTIHAFAAGSSDVGRSDEELVVDPGGKPEPQPRADFAQYRKLEVPILLSCAAQVQDKVAWDYNGSTHWADGNVARLCRGAENSGQPAACFDRVMHDGIDWGNGTRWSWANAIDLCEGTTSADRTIGCFQEQVRDGGTWQAAIRTCGK